MCEFILHWKFIAHRLLVCGSAINFLPSYQNAKVCRYVTLGRRFFCMCLLPMCLLVCIMKNAVFTIYAHRTAECTAHTHTHKNGKLNDSTFVSASSCATVCHIFISMQNYVQKVIHFVIAWSGHFAANEIIEWTVLSSKCFTTFRAQFSWHDTCKANDTLMGACIWKHTHTHKEKERQPKFNVHSQMATGWKLTSSPMLSL